MCYKILHDVESCIKLDNFDVSCKNSFQTLKGIIKKFKHNYCKIAAKGNQIVYETQFLRLKLITERKPKLEPEKPGS